MLLTMIRHGITRGNAEHIYYGATDLPLIPEGEEALKKMAAQGGYPTARHYYTTPLRRTEQTFAILYGDTPHQVIEGLREMDFGAFEMRVLPGDLENDPVFLAWCSDRTGQSVCPHGESFQQMLQRILAAMEPILAAGEDAVCVMHGVAMVYLLWHWFPETDDPFSRTPQPGTGYQVEFDGMKPVSFTPIPGGVSHTEKKWWA